MKTSLKTLIKFASSLVLSLFISSPALASTVEITYENPGTSINKSGTNSGLYEMTIDGNTTYAMSDDYNTTLGGTWDATMLTYADVQAGAGKFNLSPGDSVKYSRAGYLFSTLDFSATLSKTAEKWNALVNHVIWNVMGSGPSLNNSSVNGESSKSLYSLVTNGSYDNYDWSNTMVVYTAGALSQEFLAPLPPIATPIPSTLFLFGSMVVGFLGFATRKRI